MQTHVTRINHLVSENSSPQVTFLGAIVVMLPMVVFCGHGRCRDSAHTYILRIRAGY